MSWVVFFWVGVGAAVHQAALECERCNESGVKSVPVLGIFSKNRINSDGPGCAPILRAAMRRQWMNRRRIRRVVIPILHPAVAHQDEVAFPARRRRGRN